MMLSLYNYIFGYGIVECCNCGVKMTVKNPNKNGSPIPPIINFIISKRSFLSKAEDILNPAENINRISPSQ